MPRNIVYSNSVTDPAWYRHTRSFAWVTSWLSLSIPFASLVSGWSKDIKTTRWKFASCESLSSYVGCDVCLGPSPFWSRILQSLFQALNAWKLPSIPIKTFVDVQSKPAAGDLSSTIATFEVLRGLRTFELWLFLTKDIFCLGSRIYWWKVLVSLNEILQRAVPTKASNTYFPKYS